MIESIPKVPTLPDNLRIAAFQKSLVPFIGAGLSKLAGYPDWEELACAAISSFIEKQKISPAQFHQISDLPTRVKLSLAVELEEQHNVKVEFKKILTHSPAKGDIRTKIYEKVSGLWRFSELLVTTNYDEELDNLVPAPLLGDRDDTTGNRPAVSPSVIYALPDITVSAFDAQNAVVHLHGSVRNRESMVLTTADYLKRYYGHSYESGRYVENLFLTFLKQLFLTRNVLFIGYGAAELEILEHVIQKGIDKGLHRQSGEEPRHFLLQGFFSHQLEMARHLERYFRSFGIQLLPFSRDEHDWDGLIDVIGRLCEELPAGSRLPSTKRREMAALLT